MDADVHNVTYLSLILPYAVVLCIVLWVRREKSQPDLSHIPSVGSSYCCVGAMRFLFNAQSVLQEGYERHRLSPFKVFNLTHWTVVVASPQSIEEVRKASDNDLRACEMPHISYTLAGVGIAHDTRVMADLSTKLARSLPLLFADMHQEVIAAFRDILHSDDAAGWVQLPVVDTVTEVITRVSNRVIVGLPLCRDQEFIALHKRLLNGGSKVAAIVGMFPKTLLQVVVHLLTNLPHDVKEMQRMVQATVENREEKEQRDNGTFFSKSHDLLSEGIRECQNASSELTHRILTISLESVHSTSITFTHALYHLALADEDVMQSLRDEIDAELRHEGWTLAALERMRKVDSFLKESMRISEFRAVTMMRKSVGAYTFADGTYIPANTVLCTPSTSIHVDETKYPHARTFDAFRFARLSSHSSSSSSSSSSQYRLTTTTPDFLAWGYGRTACPGRFFAAAQMKLVLAYFVLHYDVKFLEGDDAVRPPDWCLGASRFPDLGGRVLVRKRRRGEGGALSC